MSLCLAGHVTTDWRSKVRGMQEEYMKQMQMNMVNAQKAMDLAAGKMSEMPFSLAIELAKLGKLKEQGSISDSEFQ